MIVKRWFWKSSTTQIAVTVQVLLYILKEAKWKGTTAYAQPIDLATVNGGCLENNLITILQETFLQRYVLWLS